MKELTVQSLSECIQKLKLYTETPYGLLLKKPTKMIVHPVFYKQAYLILNPWVLKRYLWLRKKR